MIAKPLYWIFIPLGIVVLFGISLFMGSVHIPAQHIFSGDLSGVEQTILLESRLPRGLAALAGGAGLALAGLLMQTLFRNPLAGPSVLGITSGASLAVALLTLGSSGMVVARYEIVGAAIAGALAVLAIILTVARKFLDVTSVLIVGLMLSFFTSAVVSLLQSLASESAIRHFVFWGFGSFANFSLSDGWFFLLPIGVILLVSAIFVKPLNALLLGEMHATSMGIGVKSLRIQLMVATGILTGIITAFCGPVAFIGLTSPHIARFLFKTVNHRVILPASILIGGALALICDVVARLPGSDHALPLNTVCAFMGAPVVIYLIVSGRKKRFLQ